MTSDCDLCGSTSRLPLPQDPRIAVCLRCGFVYVPERRTAEEVAQAWDDIYRNEQYSPKWPAVRARLFYVAEWIDQTIGFEGKSVLDIGAGDGFFLQQARMRGAHPVGLDPSSHNARGIRALDMTCHEGSIAKVGPCGQYDIVTILWTLENTTDCLAMLRYARDRLLPGGHVVVATGSRILVPPKKPLSSYLNPNVPADMHCFRFSVASLAKAMLKVGLSVLSQELRADILLTRPLMNRPQEQEWLVMAGLVRAPVDDYFPSDSPSAVLQHFADWARMWP